MKRRRMNEARWYLLPVGVVYIYSLVRSVAIAGAFSPVVKSDVNNPITASASASSSDGGEKWGHQQQQHLPNVIRKKNKIRRSGEPVGVESIFSQSVSLATKPLRRLRLRGHAKVKRGDGGGGHLQHSHSLDDSLWISALTDRGVRDGEAQLYLEQRRDEQSPDVWRLEETKIAIRDGEYGWAVASETEEARLAAMKLLLQNDFERLGIDKQRIETFPDVYGDLRLLRFLRKDKHQDACSAATRYRAFMQWRRDNDVDRIRGEVESNLFRPPAKFDEIDELAPCKLSFQHESALMSTKDTVPAILYVGKWNTPQLTQKIGKGEDQSGITMDDFLEYWTYLYESLHLYLHMESIDRRHMVYVDEACDLTGMKLRQFSPAFVTTVLKPWLRMTQLNYPETTRRIFFFNPPRIINVAWNIVTPLASPGTVAKVRFCRGYQGAVEDFVLNGDMARMAQKHVGKEAS